MTNILNQKYKVEKNNIEKAYEYQLALKHNPEYEERVNNTFVDIVTLLKKEYPNIKLESPRGREKSYNSIKNKIIKLEIERLCKLYAIEGISQEEQENLYQLVINDIEQELQQMVKELLVAEIQDLNLLDTVMQEKEMPDHIKTAILRIIKTRIKRENVENRQELETQIEEKYGETAAKKSKQLKDNLLHWECIEEIEKHGTEKLHCPFEYLNFKDLRGIKIIVADVPDSVEPKGKELKELIEQRKRAPQEEKTQYNDLCCISLTKEFAGELMKNEEWLKKLNIMVLPEGYKHKEKQNGYIAEHIKFCYRDHPEYTFELQLRSMYREDLSRANGAAAHDKRSGKKRIFPNTENKQQFIEELRYRLPQYIMLKNENDEYSLHKCSIEESVLEYYLGYIKLDSEEYAKAVQYIREMEEEQR